MSEDSFFSFKIVLMPTVPVARSHWKVIPLSSKEVRSIALTT
jgi:hypothetical protein